VNLFRLRLANDKSQKFDGCASLLVVLVIVCFAISPMAQAVVPAPDGGYPSFTTAEGTKALQTLTTGSANTAVGWFSLGSVTTGSFNTATGAGSLLFNTADDNTAFGAAALLFNTIGTENTATGADALGSNNGGNGNTANGAFALSGNSVGTANTATGGAALLSNTNGNFNTATGFSALSANMTGNGNTAMGHYALAITTGSGNTGLGANAGSALTSGANNIDIGVDVIGVAGESNTIRIGANLPETPGASACHIGGIFNQSGDPASMTAVGIDATGKLATVLSSRRFKHDIRPMDKASEAILALKPVTFHYMSDTKNTPCFGLIAEEVAEVNPDLVVRNKDGDIYTVRYDQVNAMLLNEFLKEHKTVQEQGATIAELKQKIEALTAGLQKVSAQLAAASPSAGGLEARNPAPQVASNP
jgi:hypothetical protein